ncbi:MAG: winged helix-turn-helix transcriptional regulator [Cytophagales bacterium]
MSMGKKEGTSNQLNQVLLYERCVLNKVVILIGKRWVSEILLLVEIGINRFSNLKANLSGISDHVLSTSLETLVKQNLLTKKIYQQVPLKVEYNLTSAGKELLIELHQLCRWGKQSVETD